MASSKGQNMAKMTPNSSSHGGQKVAGPNHAAPKMVDSPQKGVNYSQRMTKSTAASAGGGNWHKRGSSTGSSMHVDSPAKGHNMGNIC